MGSSSLGSRSTPTSVNVLPSSKNTKPLKLSSTLFPELPSSTASRTKPQVSGNVSLKNILGNTTGPVVPAWQPSSMGDVQPSLTGDDVRAAAVEDQGENGAVSTDATATATGPTKGKKGKGKQKQTLFTLGSFPA